MKLLSWLLVPVAFVVGLGAAVILCVLFLTAADFGASKVAEPSQPLITAFTSISLSIGCFIGAFITVFLPTFTAPEYEKETAHLAFLLGAVYAGAILSQIGWAVFIPAYLAALVSGVATVVYVGKHSTNAA
jgi:hypothetical protein